ncbi:tetratricopeptide repeat protein [Fulvimarina sp. 2208YS6-2-32]|uniref:Tetratricopeptide repeat protein n=1 Tax=Fulvimarina uroteuthidis TaxID=3098149 RepID=A0ABU5I348_9HYPH|nr:tetratricopeptide repeat protein [Fulvimarina sp. 2208YS6-2-32]MDY8109801.1 tetratricopeptide repeat protein [Fulvimarina sp. 2208YS6-2-32]
MRTSSRLLLACVAGTLFAAVPAAKAFALDPGAMADPNASPIELFAHGFQAYKRGEKDVAFQSLRYAADKGHRGACWKLARMYADGDGVPEDDYEAFRLFETIVRDPEETGANGTNAAYVASAVVALGDYLRRGIPGHVETDLPRARQFYFHAASYFGNPKAQFELGRMMLEGEGGRVNSKQAARWLKLAASKGHIGAQALLGYLLFDGKTIAIEAEPVRGLAMLTMALKRAKPDDRAWIRGLQEQAFGIASEATRRTAQSYADQQMASASGPLLQN